MRFHFNDGTTTEYGERGGSTAPGSLELRPDEYIYKVQHQQNGSNGGRFLGHGFRFTTSEGRTYKICGLYGAGMWKTHKAPAGECIVGLRFSGSGKHPGPLLGVDVAPLQERAGTTRRQALQEPAGTTQRQATDIGREIHSGWIYTGETLARVSDRTRVAHARGDQTRRESKQSPRVTGSSKHPRLTQLAAHLPTLHLSTHRYHCS